MTYVYDGRYSFGGEHSHVKVPAAVAKIPKITITLKELPKDFSSTLGKNEWEEIAYLLLVAKITQGHWVPLQFKKKYGDGLRYVEQMHRRGLLLEDRVVLPKIANTYRYWLTALAVDKIIEHIDVFGR